MKEVKALYMNGFVILLLTLLLVICSVTSFVLGIISDRNVPLILIAVILFAFVLVTLSSFTIVQPNEAKVITFFGKYMGTVLDSGFWLVIPFTNKTNVSLRARNFNSQTLKVNDAEGNPVEIAAVVVFKVMDTAKAAFEVDNYEKFVEIQSETAIRHIAALYPYDSYLDDAQLTLRGNSDEVADELKLELDNRLSVAGVKVLDTRLSHLAYAPEIAHAMLQRQQATAIVSARSKIVEGAVGMVEMALKQLEDRGIKLDDERRAAMVNNLMVAIVSERGATPVINAGTLYN